MTATHLENAIAADRAACRAMRAARTELQRIADETFERGRVCEGCQFERIEGDGIHEERTRQCEAPSPLDCPGVERVTW